MVKSPTSARKSPRELQDESLPFLQWSGNIVDEWVKCILFEHSGSILHGRNEMGLPVSLAEVRYLAWLCHFKVAIFVRFSRWILLISCTGDVAFLPRLVWEWVWSGTSWVLIVCYTIYDGINITCCICFWFVLVLPSQSAVWFVFCGLQWIESRKIWNNMSSNSGANWK